MHRHRAHKTESCLTYGQHVALVSEWEAGEGEGEQVRKLEIVGKDD